MLNLELTWNKPAKNSDERVSTDHVLRIRISPSSKKQGLPLRLAIALDTSGSMLGEKLEAAKKACRSVVDQLRDSDRLELASFATEVQPLLKSHSGGKGAVETANSAISSLQASGVTRTDKALNWIQNALPEETGIVRVGILITDGHATTPEGKILDNVTPLLNQAEKLSSEGIVLHTVGLGDAADFNTEFLYNLSTRGQGTFMYADTPQELEPELRERLTVSQAIAIDDAKLELISKIKDLNIKAFCRFSPDYLPLEETAKGILTIGSIRTDTPTDVLVKVEIPRLSPGKSPGEQEVMQVQLTASALDNPITETATILYTPEYDKSEKINSDVEASRALWEIRENIVILQRETNPNRTRQLLKTIEIEAVDHGLDDLKEQIDQLKDDLEKMGKLSPRHATKALTIANKLN
ncbi:VWA domain-containing protein [Sphaerospermopsis sp. FACHB-1194]|uniref:vWA domain-containing protein n=1 Tax=Sphaerospermopsis sp. FACHB-1194 TaxID=2692862 RepID=UPI00168055A1|nr:VWA domain-containing protein [Sphaerospermopsis sp. FACHB-1194]MBD2146749.1 VWA domain-containing protein [Sphaerospermopsis sp. FACHB-1194]